MIDANDGSSPLTRGKLTIKVLSRARFRLIPAHAGKTAASTSPRGMRPAHPRSRGENPNQRLTVRGRRGSSPLTRGKHVPLDERPFLGGLIPAHAGKTGRTTSRPLSTPAHPRSRGENFTSGSLTERPTGSSPLTRGKLLCSERSTRLPRLIPAHAGKTRSRVRRRTSW